jgi:hypothetical protein
MGTFNSYALPTNQPVSQAKCHAQFTGACQQPLTVSEASNHNTHKKSRKVLGGICAHEKWKEHIDISKAFFSLISWA